MTTTATSPVTGSEIRRQTQRELPKLDTSRVPQGLDRIEPFKGLVAKRKTLMNDALHARSAAEQAVRDVHAAREKDAAAFEQAILDGKSDPGRVHETEALTAQDDAHREAVARTRAHNRVVGEIRAAINGDGGDKALNKATSEQAKALDRIHEAAGTLSAELAAFSSWGALGNSVASTRRSDYSSVRVTAPQAIEVHTGGRQVDAGAVVEALLTWQPPEGE